MTAQLLENSFSAPPTIASAVWTALNAPTLSDITINGFAGVRLVGASLTTPKLIGTYVAKPASQWTMVARIRRHLPLGGNNALGLLMRESATGKLAIFGWTQSGVGRQRFGALTTLSGTDNLAGGAAGSYAPWDGWLKVVRDASSKYNYYISEDGNQWSLLKTEALTAPGFTVEADQIGLALNVAYNVAGISLALDCFHFTKATP